MTKQQKIAMEAARHELVTLHGLLVSDGCAPDEKWSINTSQTIALLDAVLIEFSDMDNQHS